MWSPSLKQIKVEVCWCRSEIRLTSLSHSLRTIEEHSLKTVFAPDQGFLNHVLQSVSLMRYLLGKKASWSNIFGKVWMFCLCFEIYSDSLADKEPGVLEGGESTLNPQFPLKKWMNCVMCTHWNTIEQWKQVDDCHIGMCLSNTMLDERIQPQHHAYCITPFT